MHSSEESFYKAVAIVAVLLGVIIVYFIVTMIRHQRRNARLYHSQIKAEIHTLENERRRIATDIHDELGPLLSAVRLQINHLEAPTASDNDIILKANTYIDDVLTKTREISYNLLPNTLVRKGLVAAVEEFINKINDRHTLEITFSSNGKFNFTKEQEINIYRIVQEIVNNTIKHAEATQLSIRLLIEKENAILETADNGKGFDHQAMIRENKGGLGLYNLQSRADILHARFITGSAPKEGTHYLFEIPQNQQA
ncbi:MAG TPA: ATP-binding protein [Flavipsychrobacter sp.]|nr:ATP-binding protein [Flavipsychrobacter sp.]